MFTLPDDLPGYEQTSRIFYYMHVNNIENNNSKLHFTKSCISIGINGIKNLQTAHGPDIFNSGDLVFYTPGNYLSYQNVDTDQPYKSLMIFFDAMEFSNLSKQFEETPVCCNLSTDAYYLALRNDPTVQILLRSITDLLEQVNIFTTPLQKIKLLELILFLKGKFGDFLIRGIQPFRHLTESQLRNVIENNIHSNYTLEEIAFMCNMSLATFKRYFLKIYGASPGKWIRERKLSWAEEQIRRFDRSPKELYHEAGYHDYSSFSYAFKQKFGVTPRNI